MLKKFVLLAMLMLPLATFAQEMKIAHVNSMDIYNLMPETSTMESQVATLMQAVRTELQKMEEDYNKKFAEFQQQQDSLTQSIKLIRMQEIQDSRTRLETFYEQSQQDLAQKREELNAPIVTKIRNAISSVGAKNGYTYIMEAGAFMFIGNQAVDITPLVKTELGLK